MATTKPESELACIERQAVDLARDRKERVTTAHLLAAIATLEDPAGGLLRERRLGPEGLLRAARAATDDERDPLRHAAEGAREVAERMRAPAPLAVHLLISLLGERRTAAFRALDQCGVDKRRLRLAAMNQALGALGRKPIESRAEVKGRPAAINEASAGRGPSSRAQRSAPARRRAQLVSPADLRSSRRKPVAAEDGSREAAAEALGSEAAAPEPTRPTSNQPEPRPSESRPSESRQPRLSSPAQHEERPRQSAASHHGRRATTKQTARTEDELDRRFGLPRKQFPLLSRFGDNLTLAAARGQLDQCVCRDLEVDRVLDVLCKRFGNNPCLVGPSGVGKTRIAHGVAQRMADQGGPGGAEPWLIIELGAAALVNGTGMRGGLAQRMQALRREVELGAGRVVLFFDDIHQLFLGDGGDELASEFKLAISRGELRCIGATTREEFTRTIEADAALARRFSLIEVDEPSREEAYLVLESLAPKFEAHHGVAYGHDVLALAIAWATQYVPGKVLPDKAISVLDLSGARAHRRGQPEVLPEQVAEVVSELSGVPTARLLQSDGERLLALEDTLGARVVGHGECLAAIARSVRRNAAGLGSKRPIGTFLLLGPTGVGKTETAKALAEALFFSDQAMTRIDLSEYGEPHSVARLLGAPPGYVGHEAGGQLTEAVRRRPYQVVLLDELEKAHDDVLQSFLAVFDEGRMTDGRGRTVDFSHTLIVMTSNLGAAEVTAGSPALGFQRTEVGVAQSYGARLVARVRASLAPEFFNRIDEVLVFAPLERQEVCEIARRMLERLGERLEAARGVQVRFEPSAIDALLAAGGLDLKLGARPMQRTISRLVEGPLADMILSGQVQAGRRVQLRGRGKQVVIELQPPEACVA
jgi:ATP-dependent Clp protease ATP-binding subunit ClpC